LDGLDLAVPAGCIYGFLGPNGAGKTTAIRILSTLLRPDSGTATVFGKDVVREATAVRRMVSLTGQFASTDEDLTAENNLVLIGRLLGLSRNRAGRRATELLSAFGLEMAARRQVKYFSGGMRRRLDIAASIVAMPDLLFLDEPTTGLDPHSRSQVWETIRAIVAVGTTVLLTTQYLGEADQLADRIAVMDHGKVIAEGTSADLKASAGASVLQITLDDPGQGTKAERVLAEALGWPARHKSDPASLSVRVLSNGRPDSASGRALAALSGLSRAGIAIRAFALSRPSLDEVFLTLTGHEAKAHTEEDGT
jgi:daunorubicin/doxorubicin transport system ATP-binding protein